MQQAKKPKITSKVMKKRGRECSKCKQFELNNDGIGICHAFFTNDDHSARGARSEEKYCGRGGKKFELIGTGKPTIREREAELDRREAELESTELESTDADIEPELTRQQKAAITRKANQANAGVGSGS